jgi:tetratricopeptide (TPR) repeat protein
MSVKFLTLAAAGAIALLPSLKASANETVVPAGPDLMRQCSDFAAQTATAGAAPQRALIVCGEAILQAKDDALATAYVNRAAIHLARQENAAALADSNMAIRIEANVPEAYINRGIALNAEKHYVEADAAFTAALTLNPSRPEMVYFSRALAREDAGDLNGAYLDYRKAAQIAPIWDSPKQQLARFAVGHAAAS